MAYTKLVTCGQNYAVGYQSVNLARDNVDAHYIAWSKYHGTREGVPARFGPYPAPAVTDPLGHHNDERIPRDSVLVQNVQSGGAVIVTTSPSNMIGGGVLISKGVYRFLVSGLSLFWGHCAIKGSGFVELYSCKSVYPVAAAPYLEVATFFCGLAGTSYSPSYSDFTLTVYGDP